MTELDLQAKRQLRQVTLAQLRGFPDVAEGIARLVVESHVLPKSHANINTWYLGPSRLCLEYRTFKKKAPRIKRLTTHLVGIDWVFTEEDVQRQSFAKWAAAEDSHESGTFFIDTGVTQLLQLFREDGEGRPLLEVEALNWYDAAFRQRYINEKRYQEKSAEILENLPKESPTTRGDQA